VFFPILQLLPNGSTTTTAAVGAGTIYVDFERHADNEMSLTFPRGALVQLKRSVRFRAEVDEYTARIGVFKGELVLDGPERALVVKRNETVSVDLNDPAHYALANAITSSPYDSWNGDRERYRG